MGCDFKVGDDVVCYRHLDDAGVADGMPPIGHVDTIRFIGRPKDGGPEWGLLLISHRAPGDSGMNAVCFRKVQRLDLADWLATGSTFEEPRRAPAKKRERA